MKYQDILYEVRNGAAWITINRPEKMNAFRGQTCDELIHAPLKGRFRAALQLPARGGRLAVGSAKWSTFAGHPLLALEHFR